jgi:hypothetical protein
VTRWLPSFNSFGLKRAGAWSILKINNKGETQMTIRPIVSHLVHKRFVERTSTVLLLGILWSSLAVCVLAALSYDIVYWLGAS